MCCLQITATLTVYFHPKPLITAGIKNKNSSSQQTSHQQLYQATYSLCGSKRSDGR